MVEVVATDEFVAWLDELDAPDNKIVLHLVDLLERAGLGLGFPYSSDINGATFALRELRHKGGRPIRVFYAFDPRRNAVLIIGGDKTGDARFYERMIPLATRIWKQYLAEQAAGEHEDE